MRKRAGAFTREKKPGDTRIEQLRTRWKSRYRSLRSIFLWAFFDKKACRFNREGAAKALWRYLKTGSLERCVGDYVYKVLHRVLPPPRHAIA